MTKVKKPEKENEKANDKLVKVKTPSNPREEEEKSFDFGGLPSRDLKKNLGCG